MKLIKSLILASSLALVSAACAQKITFADKSGKMTLNNIDNWSTRLTGPDTLHFKAVGNKLNGAWSSLGLTVTARSIEGDAKRSGTALSLQKATLSGGVHVVVKRPLQVVETDSSTAVITSEGDVMIIQLDGGVVIDSKSLQTGERMHATGSNGNARVTPTTGLGKATLSGPVTIDMDRPGVPNPSHIHAKSKRLDIDRMSDPATITLTGDVSIQGNDPVIAGDIQASKAVITLDSKGQPVGMDAEGQPGTMKFKEKAAA